MGNEGIDYNTGRFSAKQQRRFFLTGILPGEPGNEAEPTPEEAAIAAAIADHKCPSCGQNHCDGECQE